MPLTSTLSAAPNVKAECPDLLPQQQRSRAGFLRSTNAFVRNFLKHPNLSYFHSYPELLHAALLEADTDVTSFTPQPFQLWIGRKRYVPDCFVVRGTKRQVIELKPKGEMEPAAAKSLKEFFNLRQMDFFVVANEEVLGQEILAKNWLKIVQNLTLHKDIDTEAYEQEVFDLIGLRPTIELGEIIGVARASFSQRLLAVHRLLHKGLLRADLVREPTNVRTVIELC